MSNASESRLRELDAVLDGVSVTPELSGELFAVVDALEASPALRRALSDPAAGDSAKKALVDSLFASRVGQAALTVLTAGSVRRWGSPRRLVDAIERQAVRAELAAASAAGTLDEVIDELFRFGQTVAGDHQLRDALAQSRAPLAVREQLVGTLLDAKVQPPTAALARRAVKARERTYALTLDSYAQIAAQMRGRQVAKVTVATMLNEQESARLAAALTRLAGRPVDIQLSVDPQVLGGVRVQLGDEVIEGTVAHRLEDARRQIA